MKKLLLPVIAACMITSFSPKEITWVAIGDSITWLNEHTEDTKGRITKGYMTGVAEKLPYIHYINQGYNGWSSGDIAKDIDKLGLQKADVYSIFLGTNDWWYGRRLGTLSDYINNSGNTTVYGSFRIIINKLKSLNSEAKIILITPMQRVDFVSLGDMKNNAWGSYKSKEEQSLSQFATAIRAIGKYGHCKVVDLYNEKELGLKSLVKYKRLKDPATGEYRNYPYPDFIAIPFNPEKDDYPYPPEAMGITYDGLHPSDKGFEIISKMLVKIMREYR